MNTFELPRHAMRRRALGTLLAWLFALVQMFANGCIAAPAAPGDDPCPMGAAASPPGSEDLPAGQRTPCAKFCSDEAGGVTPTAKIVTDLPLAAALPGPGPWATLAFGSAQDPGSAARAGHDPPAGQPPPHIVYRRLSL